MLREVLKIFEKCYLLMQKLIKTTKNKPSGGCIFQVFTRSTFKTWNTKQKGHIFFIWLWLVLYQSWYCLLITGGWLNGQNLLSVIEVIYRQSLTPGFLHYVQNFVRSICVSSQLHPNTLKILNDFFFCHLLLWKGGGVIKMLMPIVAATYII